MTAFVTPILKPLPRGPRPKKPIARTSRPAKVRRTAASRTRQSLNRLWSKVIMAKKTYTTTDSEGEWIIFPYPGACWLKLTHEDFRPAIDPAHLWPKSTHPTIRHHPMNGVPACRECHNYLDANKVDRELVAERFAPGLRAESFKPTPDPDVVRRTLNAELKRLGGRQ